MVNHNHTFCSGYPLETFTLAPVLLGGVAVLVEYKDTGAPLVCQPKKPYFLNISFVTRS
jgi:hypothetical protein